MNAIKNLYKTFDQRSQNKNKLIEITLVYLITHIYSLL